MSLTTPALLSYTYVPLTGPYAAAGLTHLGGLWNRIRDGLAFDAPVEGLPVPAEFSPPGIERGSGGNRLLAACQRRDDEVWQASIRAEHDVLCLTLMMALPRLGEFAAAWLDLERQLDGIGIDSGSKHVLGESRLFLGLSDSDWDETHTSVRAAVPPPSHPGWWRRSDHLALDKTGRATVWEFGASFDDRSLRRLALVAAVDQERALDRLVWTDGEGELAPFARYLLHAAKLRYQIRVFHNGRVCERTRDQLDELEDELFHADSSQQVAHERFDRAHRNAAIVHSRLTTMRRGVGVIVDNLRNALRTCRPEGSVGPISDDLALVDWFTARLDDEAAQLADACARARSILDRGTPVPAARHDPVPPVEPAGGDGPPLIFISYIHDSPQHMSDVLRFAEFLRHNGIDAQLDRWFAVRRQDWYQWVLDLIPRADFVIVIASPMCRKVGDGQIPGHLNLGGQSEMTLLRELLQSDRSKWTAKLLPVVLPGHDWRTEVPLFLQGSTADHYPVEDLTPAGAEYLLRTITGQHPNPPPPLGPRVTFPSAKD